MTKWIILTLGILLFLFLIIVGIASAAGSKFAGALWYDPIGRLGIGVQNPTERIDADGNIKASGKVISEGLNSLHGLATSTATSASNSNNKLITAWCPSNYSVTGGGGEILAGNDKDIAINSSYPTATTSGWIVDFRETSGIPGNWTARTHAICTRK